MKFAWHTSLCYEKLAVVSLPKVKRPEWGEVAPPPARGSSRLEASLRPPGYIQNARLPHTRTDPMSAPNEGRILDKAKELCRCEGKAWNLDDFGNGVLGVTMLTVVADDNDRTYFLNRAKAFLKQK
jgi:hypothetical protein